MPAKSVCFPGCLSNRGRLPAERPLEELSESEIEVLNVVEVNFCLPPLNLCLPPLFLALSLSPAVFPPWQPIFFANFRFWCLAQSHLCRLDLLQEQSDPGSSFEVIVSSACHINAF